MSIKDNSNRARIVIVMFWVFVVINIIAIISSLFEYNLLQRAKDGANISMNEAQLNDVRQNYIKVVSLLIYIALIVLFINWFRRAYSNLQRLQIKTKYKDRMAIWSFFIPILNLQWPFEIMEEIWQKSIAHITYFKPDNNLNPNSTFIGIWWIVLLISNFAGNITSRLFGNGENIDELMQASIANMAFNFLVIISALLAIYVINKVSNIEDMLKSTVEEHKEAEIDQKSKYHEEYYDNR